MPANSTLFGDRVPISSRTARRRLNATIGYAGFTPDGDGSLRRVKDQGRQDVGFLGLPTLAVRAAKASGTSLAEFPDGGAWIDYAGAAGTYPQVSLVDVRNGAVPASRFAGKIVIVGETSLSGTDVHPTPAAGGTRMSGPEIHANAIATARAGLPFRDAPPWAAVALLLALATIPAALARRARPALALGLSALAGAACLAGVQVAFEAGWILPVLAPILALVLSAVAAQLAARLWSGARKRARARP